MKKLQPDWFTQNWLDAEYQKYVVMAYLQAVQENFTANKLYPDLPELRSHYADGIRFSRGKGTLNAAFPKRISGVGGPPPRIEYKSEVTDPAYMTEMDAIMDFALPRFQTMLTEGQQRWTDIADSLTLAPVGLMPLNPEEGYLLLYATNQSEAQVYQFSLTFYSDQEPGGRMVQLRFVEAVRTSLVNTFEAIKLDLIRRYRQLPNPATYRLETTRTYPVHETLLPIARQLLAQAVA
ncbi:hypothetical protein [Spirosoma utsteinense]|uniref:Uncharacterized protein n=1 Tax=Spirosoma utsteinense TaxID=2585773 RepID=A0ABR6W673_9BACT|nr:hypothetical protein [Spirosoma utsteinense]MBC3785873.1 hypothetical protein [Spirosoma utsteinense]MBC3792045.1 hypothetical protein [Spirosoma utsteinense]